MCLAARVPQCRVIGLELQRDLVRLAGDNALLNGMGDRLSVMVGDLLQPPPRLSPGSFDHVMANPPFIERGRGSEVLNPARAAATIEGDAALREWVRFALVMARSKGTVTFIEHEEGIALEIDDMKPVGNYALEIDWFDGHTTGIYSYTYLRSLCQCAACRK